MRNVTETFSLVSRPFFFLFRAMNSKILTETLFVAATQTKGLTTRRNITVLASESFAKAAVISTRLVLFNPRRLSVFTKTVQLLILCPFKSRPIMDFICVLEDFLEC